MDWTKRYNYNYPTSVRFGVGVVDEVAQHLKDQKLGHAFVVSDPVFSQLPVYQKTKDMLSQSGLKVSEFFEIAKNPVKSNVLKGVKIFNQAQCDCIIGFGGGASMDVARAIALMANHLDFDLFDFDDAIDGWKNVSKSIPYFITIPTTSGTGSEVGRSTVISDDTTHAKKILFAPQLMAKKVFADPALTMGLPPFVTAATGLDALTHNLEAFLAPGVHPMADGIALEGIRLVFESLEKATKNQDLESRAKMQMAALMGATAFQKGLGVVHSLAHPLSTVFDMHHGLANAIMLSYGMEFNLSVCEEKFKRIMAFCGLKGGSGSDFVSYLKEFNGRVGMPLSLRDQIKNVTKEQKERLVELAVLDPCHQSNPKKVGAEDFIHLYEKAFHA